MGTILKNGINYSGTSGGSGVSSYNELTEKPKIEGVVLSGNKTASDLGLAKASDIPSTDTCYATSDTAETTIADGDYFPFQDVSASAKRKTLWSNIKSVLKTYFDTLYSTTKTRGTATSGGTTLSLVNTGDMYTWNNKQNALTAGTNITISSNTISASLPVLGTINRSDIYDTTEKVIGKWTDGKPVYQKIIQFTSPTPTQDGEQVSSSYAVGVSVDKFVKIEGIINIGEAYCPLVKEVIQTTSIRATTTSEHFHGIRIVMITGYSNSYSDSSVKNTVRIANSNVNYGGKTGYVIVQYTKTTDAANSYNYAEENDYSTSEKIIGTWIDGSTLYQKTINFGTLPNNTTKTVAHSISGTFTVVDMKAIAINGTTQTFASEFYDGTSYCFINRLGTNIQAKTNANFTSYSVYVTIKYVKKQL